MELAVIQNHMPMLSYGGEHDAWEGDGEEDEDIIDIDVAEVKATALELKNRWLVIGLFYSNQVYNPKYLFNAMSAAWALQVPAAMRDLGNKCYLIELGSERSFNYVLNGGPWKYRGEGFLVVPCDGVSQAL